ncbi:MAG: protein-tyrosine-phosphatase [Bacteroidetes bacterium]|nr:protein-tyrosine-phosphatase [Bacteroidota bacterium]
MFAAIKTQIEQFSADEISAERKGKLQALVDFMQNKKDSHEIIRLNFICTHNSRRSHLSQIWAQTMACHFNIPNVYCYSGGTEATAMFPQVTETLSAQGFQIQRLSEDQNPVYAIKYGSNEQAMICFSKVYQDTFNPQSNYAAIMTCNSADEGCPVVLGAAARFSIPYEDPKAFDGTDLQSKMYAERSLEIAREMYFVMSSIL